MRYLEILSAKFSVIHCTGIRSVYSHSVYYEYLNVYCISRHILVIYLVYNNCCHLNNIDVYSIMYCFRFQKPLVYTLVNLLSLNKSSLQL